MRSSANYLLNTKRKKSLLFIFKMSKVCIVCMMGKKSHYQRKASSGSSKKLNAKRAILHLIDNESSLHKIYTVENEDIYIYIMTL